MIKRRHFSLDYWTSKAVELYLRATVSPPPGLNALPGYLHPQEGLFLHWVAARVPPGGRVLEVGSFKGKSSSFIASGLRSHGSRLHCVDVWQNRSMPYDPPEDVFPEFEANLARYRNRIEVHRGESTDIAAQWTLPIDVLFIDGDHSYEGALNDMNAWLPHVKRGGWVALHDAGTPGVQRAAAEKFPPSQRTHGVHIGSTFAARKR